MALDMQRVRLREAKNAERRYGISLVWFPDKALLDAVNACIASVERAFPDFLIRYSVPHASIFRCKSLHAPLGHVKDIALLAEGARELHRADIAAQQMILCDDGVLRLQCSALPLGGSESLKRFFEANGLRFEQIDAPWISFGLLNVERYASEQASEALQTAVGKAEFPQMRCSVDCLHAVAYDDILLHSRRVLAVLTLGGEAL